jgi:hypothetical protein
MHANSVLLTQDGTNMAKLKKDNSGIKSGPMKRQTNDKNKVELKYRSTAMKNKKSFKPATESVTKGLPIGPKAVPMPKSNIGLKSKGNKGIIKKTFKDSKGSKGIYK